MFGEKDIVGTSKLEVVAGKKIKLPDYCFAAPGDNIALLNSKGDQKYILLNDKYIDDIYDFYKYKMSNSKDNNEYRYYRNCIRSIFSSIKENFIVDKKCYIKFPEKIGTLFKCEGDKKLLILEKLK